MELILSVVECFAIGKTAMHVACLHGTSGNKLSIQGKTVLAVLDVQDF